MKKLISPKLAGNVLVMFMALLAVFHVLVLFQVVPSDIVWGGQIKDSSNNLITLEMIALLVTLIFLIIIAAKTGYIRVSKFKKAVNVGVWVIFAYLILNTVGNLASSVSFENLVLAPITLLMALFALRLAIEK
ncbi:MAG TPA: hypothetical protein VMW42_07925 [Desulfatiglandales bacterium]|nr:hypothetical protein [Desulfatiglandales bacterium]